MNSDSLQGHPTVETLPEHLKRMYNLQNGASDIPSIRANVFDDLDVESSITGSMHSRDRQQPLDTSPSLPKNWIRLNVGGKIFQTTRDTLMRVPGSFLYRLCQDDKRLPSVKDETGAYLIDRDADYFSPVLNYLRHGRLIINPGLADEGVLEEAEFYNLPQLVHLVNERIHEKERSASDNGRVKSVYRVIQCHEDELTTFISATSDGWKIVQDFWIFIGRLVTSTRINLQFMQLISLKSGMIGTKLADLLTSAPLSSEFWMDGSAELSTLITHNIVVFMQDELLRLCTRQMGQVLPVQTKYQDYTVDRQQEYLCIVVRECPDNGSVSDSRDRATLLQQKARHN